MSTSGCAQWLVGQVWCAGVCVHGCSFHVARAVTRASCRPCMSARANPGAPQPHPTPTTPSPARVMSSNDVSARQRLSAPGGPSNDLANYRETVLLCPVAPVARAICMPAPRRGAAGAPRRARNTWHDGSNEARGRRPECWPHSNQRGSHSTTFRSHVQCQPFLGSYRWYDPHCVFKQS